MVLLAASLFGCGGDGTEPEPSSDTTPPLVSIVFPDSVGFDEDGDGFLDLRVVWSDTDSGIDLSSLRVRGIGSDSNSPNDNISDGWTTAQHDSTGLRLAETLSGLLPDQETRLEVSIADRAGNRRADTVRVTLPSGQLLTTLAGRGPGYFIVDALLCDDGLIYMTPGNAIMTVDPVRLQVTSIQAHPTYIGDQRYLACPRNSPRVYATPRMFQYDRMIDQWTLDWVRPGHFQAVAESKRESGLIYAGVGGLGVVAEVMAGDTIQRRLIPMPSSSMEREQVSALAVLPDDRKIYISRIEEGGVLSVDPRTGEILKRIKISGPESTYPGRSDAFALSADGRTLYVAILDGDPRGIAVVDTDTDEIRTIIPLPNSVPLDLALSPNGNRLFITVAERFDWLPAYNVLFDLQEWRVVAQFPRERPAGANRWDNGVVWRSDGKLVFVGHNMDVDVYLNRE